MKKKTWTRLQLLNMSHSEYWWWDMCVRLKLWGFMGVGKFKKLEFSHDQFTGEYTLQWEELA